MATPNAVRSDGRIAALKTRYAPSLAQLKGSDTAKAAMLAGAMIVNNVIALVSTVVFARELTDYGSLGALISYLLILTVAGQAMQVATARDGVLGHLGFGRDLVRTMRSWTRSIMIVTGILTVVSILLRQQIADAVGVKDYPWAAALGIPAGCLYLEVSLLRGGLQGVGEYRSVGMSLVGEQGTRLVAGAILAIGLSVTGAYLGSLLSYLAMSVYCLVKLNQYAEAHAATRGDLTGARSAASAAAAPLGAPEGITAEPPASGPALSLWAHIRQAWAPIAGLVVIAMLQNVDIIAAKHQFTKADATSYAAVAVAAKVMIWVAIGAGFYLVPEVSRRRAEGLDTRSVLAKALGIIAACAIPSLLIFAVASHLLMSAVFGPKKATASDSLLILGVAFSVLAATYLAIQYMLALKRTWFLAIVGLVAVAEPILLLHASRQPKNFAAVVLAVQVVGALAAFALALRRSRRSNPPPPPPRRAMEQPELREAVSSGSV